jgi:hypothetical protein
MAIEKIIDLQIHTNVDVTAEKILTLKQQLKIAKAEVLAMSDAFGITSQQAIHAAERAAELGHEISAANKLVKTFNPSTTLNSTTQALGSVKEGFEVASHTMKTFGVESTQLEGALGKVGVAMELTSGITAIQESGESFKRLGATLKSYSVIQKIITAGQWLWNAAIAANPIGALVAAIVAVIAAGYALTKYFMSNAEASHKNEKAIKENSKALNEQIKTADKNTEAFDINSKQKLAMAKASGKSAEEIRKLELKLIDEKIAFEKSSREIAKNTFYKNQNTLATLKGAGADEEQIKNQEEVTKKSLEEFGKQTKNLNDAVKEKLSITNRHLVEIRQSETKHNEDLRTKAKEAAEKAADELKAQKKKDAEDLKAALLAAKNAELTSREEISKSIGDAQDRQAEKNMTASEIEQRVVKDKYFGLIELAKQQNRSKDEIDVLEIQRLNELNAIKDKYRLEEDAKKATELEKIITDSTATFDARLAAVDSEQALYKKQFDDKLITEKDYNEKIGQLSKSRVEIDKSEADAKKAILQKTSDVLNKGADLLGKNTAAGKAMAVAAALINTYQGITAELATKTVTPFEIGLKIANVAIIAATGFKAVKNILAVKVPGGGGGGSVPDGASAAGGGAPTAPSFNVVGSSSTNQLAQTIGQQQQQPIQAYVVANNVTTAQSLQRNIIESATIGG